MFGNNKKDSGSKIDQLRYLSQSALLEEKSAPYLIRSTLFIISAAIILLIIWASFTKIEEVSVANGNIIPSTNMQSIQHLEGGIISEIKVKEGDLVKKGDVLLVLEGSSVKNDLESLESKRKALEYRAIRLRSFINNTKPEFNIDSASLEDKRLMREQMNAYNSTIQAKEDEHEIIEDQINQKKSLIEGLQEKQKTAIENLRLTIEEKDLKEKLYKQGHLSKFKFLQIQKQLNFINGQKQENESKIEEARGALAEYQNRLDSLNSKFIDKSHSELTQVDTILSQTKESIDKYSDMVNRLEITAPLDGYIKVLNINTIGGVIESGRVIAEIVPMGSELLVEAQINPKDIGYLSVGQDANIKISTYDYSRYGTLKGKLSYISASAFENDEGRRFYLGRVSVEKNYLGNDKTKNIIRPGMVAQVDIVTGSKSIISYLLKPIHKSVTSSFSER
ncbi:MAG: hypothetical protein DGJ47_000282 [Rickettsiaceae bacterium]